MVMFCRENFGTNPDHVRNILTNCGIRQPEYGDRRIHYFNTRKRGIRSCILRVEMKIDSLKENDEVLSV